MAVVLLFISGCESSSSNGRGHPSGTVTPLVTKGKAGVFRSDQNAGNAVWVNTLDPAVVLDSASISDIDMVNANLVKLDYPSLKVIPDLAKHWTTSSNHLTWTFYIRKNAKFANGDRVTAADAAWSITRSLLPETKSPVATTYLGHIMGAVAVSNGKATKISGLKVVNTHMLQITLDKPIANFLANLSYPTADVLDKKVMQGKAAASYLTNTCSGNAGAGPFEFACRNRSSDRSSFYPNGHSPYMDFKPNPYYYGAGPTIRVHAPFYVSADDAFHAYQTGQLDDTSVPAEDTAIAQRMSGYTKKATLTTDYITPNSQIAPFNNIHCRLAVSFAVDRVHITRDLLHGTEGPLYDVLPPGLAGYFDNPQKYHVPYFDPARARKELIQCPGHLAHVTMTYQNTSPDIVREFQAVKADLKAIGARVTLKPLTFNAWVTVVAQSMNATKDQENITENFWVGEYPDAQDWFDNLLHSGADYNIGGFSNPRFDKLVNAGNGEFNQAKRQQDYIQGQQIVLQDGGWIGVGFGYFSAVINPRVHGLLNANGRIVPEGNDWSKVGFS